MSTTAGHVAATPDATPRRALSMTLRQRLAMVAIGYIPLLNVVAITALVTLSAMRVWPAWTAWLAPAWLLLAPPAVVRLVLALRPLPEHDISLASSTFLVWWFTSQWQVIFNRLPWIEELVRLVPGLYSAWLRLWGARVGRFVYWTPGLRVLDRSMIEVGDRVVFGAGVKINPHVIMRGGSGAGELVLKVATVRIGHDALVGGYSLLTCGSWIAPGEASPGKRDFRPFTGWANGRRVDPSQQGEGHDD